ncbi:MAG: VOC family protein [Candidatus Bathyarchaeota archaeon]|nr:VOC family protein [Candidatus Bathyarchaeota archaeon]
MKTGQGLRVYDTGHITFYLVEVTPHPPIPSFTVPDLDEAKKHLTRNGCVILEERPSGFYFRDPTGVTFDSIES